MSLASRQTLLRARHVAPASLGRPFTEIADAYRRWRLDRHNRQIVAELTDAQLGDAGIDRAAVHGNGPSLEVTAGLMTNLMSMR